MNDPRHPTREETEEAAANPPVPGDSDDGTAVPAQSASPAAGPASSSFSSSPAPAPAPAPAPPPKKIRATPATIGIMVVVAAVGIALIMWAWHIGPFNSTRMSTDNAYVRGAITVLSPQVNGYVDEVLVKDFQYVKAGQELLRIDNRIYAERVRQAEGQLANAVAQLENAAQTQAQNQATLGAARANLAAT
ncbi:biotin/lipoyl-binding protein, partial [Massilia sp.]|uniref:HlyD family secretion protein n=1 Tax=Massilia sp. TaxID=1882437 RepID=UPI0028A01A1C